MLSNKLISGHFLFLRFIKLGNYSKLYFTDDEFPFIFSLA